MPEKTETWVRSPEHDVAEAIRNEWQTVLFGYRCQHGHIMLFHPGEFEEDYTCVDCAQEDDGYCTMEDDIYA